MLWLSDLWSWVSTMAAKFWHAVYPSGRSPRAYQECFKTQTPCRGDAFVFDVTVRELWTYRGNFDMFDLDARKKYQRAEVERRLRAVSRRYPPEATVLFENAMNGELTAVKFDDGSKLTCAYSVQIAPDEELAEHLRATAIKRMGLNHLEEMQARWLAFLKHLDDDPLGQMAARLAGDEDLAAAINQRATDQQRIFEDLRKMFDRATATYSDVDVFDLVMSTDSALSRLLRHIRADETPSPNGSKPAAD
jgi:hypothetical protein